MKYSTIIVITILRAGGFRILGAECVIYTIDITCAWSKRVSVVSIPQTTTCRLIENKNLI